MEESVLNPARDSLPFLIGAFVIAMVALHDFVRARRQEKETSPRSFYPGTFEYLKPFIAPFILVLFALSFDPAIWRGIDHNAIELVDLGASYLPKTVTQPWRLLTSLFIHANLRSLLISAFSLVVLGRAVVATAGSWFFLTTLLLSNVAAAMASSAIAPQMETFGFAPAVAGLAGSCLSLFSDRDRRSRIGRATAATALLHFAYFLLAPWGTTVQGLLAGASTGAVLVFVVILLPVRTRMARSASATIVTAGLGLCFAFLPHPTDRLAFYSRLVANTKATNQALLALQEQYASHLLGDAEFARRIDTDALAPTRLNIDEVEALLSQESDEFLILETKKSELEYRRISLEILRDVHAAKDLVLKAESLHKSQPDASEAELNKFWSRSLPILNAHRNAVEKLNHPELSTAVAALRQGLARDIADLTESAVDLEIKQTEIWLMRLRTQFYDEPTREIASQPHRAPSDLGPRVDARLRRMAAVAERLPTRNERLEGLQSHLSHIRSAIR
jgi:membrane associated rhomboid family serine protease